MLVASIMAKGLGVSRIEYLRLSIRETNVDEKEEFLYVKTIAEVVVENWEMFWKHWIKL